MGICLLWKCSGLSQSTAKKMFLEYSKLMYRKKTKANSVCIEYFSGITTCLEICYAQFIVLEMMMI
jgi:hypothetical protein